jgi:hypothetical protein
MSRAGSVGLAIVVVLGASGVVACASVLGLDAPIPCEGGNCPDATEPGRDADETSLGEDSSDSPQDAGFDSLLDAGPDTTADSTAPTDAMPDVGVGEAASPPTGLRCGTSLYCDAGKTCCITATAASTSFACVESRSQCADFWVQCASNRDCMPQDHCCYFQSNIACGSNTCSDVVCNQYDGGGCDAAQTCQASIYETNTTPPYFLPYGACQ